MLAQLPAMEPVIDVVAVSEVDRLKPPRGQLLVHHSRVVGTWQLWVPCARPRTLGLYGGETTSNGYRSRSPERSSSGPERSARLCGGARPRSPGTWQCGDRGRHAFLPAGRRRRLRETPVTPITQYQREPDPRPGGGARSGRPQFRASMRRPALSRCSPTGDDSPTPPRGERAGRRHSAGASSLLPPDPPPLIPERAGMLSPLIRPRRCVVLGVRPYAATATAIAMIARRHARNVRCGRLRTRPLVLFMPMAERSGPLACDVGHTCACPDATGGRPAVLGSSPATAAPCRDWACCAGRGAWPARSRRGSARRLPASAG